MIQKPPSCSFVSANGPSVMIGSPPSVGATTVAELGRVQTAAEHPRARGLELGVERVDLLERLLHHFGIVGDRVVRSLCHTESMYWVMCWSFRVGRRSLAAG